MFSRTFFFFSSMPPVSLCNAFSDILSLVALVTSVLCTPGLWMAVLGSAVWELSTPVRASPAQTPWSHSGSNWGVSCRWEHGSHQSTEVCTRRAPRSAHTEHLSSQPQDFSSVEVFITLPEQCSFSIPGFYIGAGYQTTMLFPDNKICSCL